MTVLIVLDFDGTITEEDTVDSLARSAIYYARTDSRATTPTLASPNALPPLVLPEPVCPEGYEKVVFKLEPPTEDKPESIEEKQSVTEDKPSLAKENENPARVDDTVVDETASTSSLSPSPSPSISGAKSPNAMILSTPSVLSPTLSFVSTTSLMDIWNFTLVEGYINDVKKFESEYTPGEDARLTWEEEMDFLEQLNAIELESIKRVECSPIFRDFYDEDFRKFGRQAVRIGFEGSEDTYPEGPRGVELRPVKIRKGFDTFVHQAMLKEGQLGLVSINWSQEFIEGVLDASNEKSHLPVGPVDDENPDEDEDMDLDEEERYYKCNSDIDDDLARLAGGLRLETTVDTTLDKFSRIMANHITPVGNIDGPPAWKRPIITAKDKETVFGQLKADLRGWTNSVYIGDSRTDILCLREADLGIAIASDPDKSGLLKTLRRLVGDIPHVSEAVVPGAGLAWARDFDEILQSEIMWDLSKRE